MANHTCKHLFIMLIFLLLCSTSNATEYRIAAVLKALNSDYWHSVEAGLIDAAKKYNVDIHVMGPSAETQVIMQCNIIQDQIAKKIDALIVAPIRPESIKGILEQAYKNKIPVIAIDTDAKWNKQIAFIGTGNFYASKLAGEYIAKQLNGKGNVAIIRGAMGDYIFDERTKGFLAGIKNSSINVLTVQPANSERGLAFNVTQNILQTHRKKIDAIYAENDEMALGAVMAIKSANIDKKILTVGFDAIPDAIKSILEGNLTATVKQNSYEIGYKSVEIAYSYLKGKKVDKYIPIPAQIIDKSNVMDEVQSLIKIFGYKRTEKLIGKNIISKIKNSNE